MARTCTSCQRNLPEESFQLAGGKRRSACALCNNDLQRVRSPLPPVKRDPELIRINNAVELWHGPARRHAALTWST